MNTRPNESSHQRPSGEDRRKDHQAKGAAASDIAEPGIARDSIEAAASLGAELKDVAQTTSRAIRKQAAAFAREVGHELGATAEQQRARGADAMKAFSRAMTAAAAELKAQSPAAARYARDAAQSIEGLSSSIKDRSATALMHSASDAARTRPMLFFAGAIAAGFTLSRFLKSSAAREHSPHGTPAREHADD